MEMVKRGLILDDDEQEVWARANTWSTEPLSKTDLEAIAAEHTESPESGEAEPWERKLSVVDFGRAQKMLAGLAERHGLLLQTGVLQINPPAERQVRDSVQTAIDMQRAMNDHTTALSGR